MDSADGPPLLPPELLSIIAGLLVHADIANIVRYSTVSHVFKAACDRHCTKCASCGKMRVLKPHMKPFDVRPSLVDKLGLGAREHNVRSSSDEDCRSQQWSRNSYKIYAAYYPLVECMADHCSGSYLGP